MTDIRVPSFLLPAGRTGALLIHGFTASPAEMRPLGEFLHRGGLTVCGIRLAGHGTAPEDLARTRWQDWYATAAAGLEQLRGHCDSLFVAGLSMGAVLGILLAARSPDRIRGLCLLAPALRLRSRPLFLARWLQPLVGAIPKSPRTNAYLSERGLFAYPVMPLPALVQLHLLIGEGRRELDRMVQPTLVCMGQQDRTVVPASGLRIFERLRSAAKDLILLPGADHILTVEPGAEFLFERIQRFIERHDLRPT
jgi:carboxylesterase